MKVQKYERHATPFNERIRYFFEVIFWLIILLLVLFMLLLAYLEISKLFAPTGHYTGNPAFAADTWLCLDTRPKSELFDCLGEYGWFDTPAKIQLGD